MKKYLLLAVMFVVFTSQILPQQNRRENTYERVFKSPSTAPFISEWDKVPSEIKDKNSFKRFEWFYRSRLDARGDFPKEFIDRQRDIDKQRLVYNENNVWTNLGPTGIDLSGSNPSHWGINSGRIRGLAIHPTNPDIVYIGAAAGGIWKTTNGGNNWSDISGGFTLITFGSIALDPTNPEIIYAGTGETRYSFNNVTFEGDGLYKSTDGGNSWTRITDGFGSQTQFSDIIVSPANPNIVIASIGTGNWNNQTPDNVGLWRSSDAGMTWTRIINNNGVYDLAFHPVDNKIVFAAVGNKSSLGFQVSTDAGLTWTASNSGLPGQTQRARMQFDIAKSNPSIMYCLVFNNTANIGGMQTGAFKSTNGGTNWMQIATGENIAGTYNGTTISDQGGYDLCVAVSPTDPLTAFFGNVEISKTINGLDISFVRNPNGHYGGANAWDGWTHTDIHIIRYADSNPSIMYVGCDGGIYKSTNAGANFFHVNNGINSIQFYRVASHPTNENILYGGAQDNGNFRTHNKGTTNWIFSTTGDGMECFVDRSNSDRAYISTQNGSLYRTTNGGINWLNAIRNVTNTAWTAPYWQHPTANNKIFAALGRSIYRSDEYGANNTWNNVSGEISSTNLITTVAHSPANTNNMIVVFSNYTVNPQVYLSTNEGVDFSEITSNLTGSGFTQALIQRVSPDPTNGNTFYITRASYEDGQVIKTTDLGQTWTDISSNLPKISTNAFFADPINSGHLYAANDFGVYRSLNNGTNWIRLGFNFPYVPVLSFSYFSNGMKRYLRAATHGRGVYELDIMGTVGINSNNGEIPSDYKLFQNYPNPFNPVTKISFQLSVVSLSTLKIFDITGKEVATLLNEQLKAGTYTVDWNASGYPSGVYFYKLQAGNFIEAKKMMLVR